MLTIPLWNFGHNNFSSSLDTNIVSWHFLRRARGEFAGGRWTVAMSLLGALPDFAIVPDVRLFNTVLGRFGGFLYLTVTSLFASCWVLGGAQISAFESIFNLRCWACALPQVSGRKAPPCSRTCAGRPFSRIPSASACASPRASGPLAGKEPLRIYRRWPHGV